MHLLENSAGSTYSSTSDLLPHEQLERQAGFPSSDKTRPDSPVPTLHPDAGKDGGQEEKGTTEDEMVGWHHRLSGHGFGWTPGVGDGQGGLACCDSWDMGTHSNILAWKIPWTEEPGELQSMGLQRVRLY